MFSFYKGTSSPKQSKNSLFSVFIKNHVNFDNFFFSNSKKNLKIFQASYGVLSDDLRNARKLLATRP